MQNSLPSGSNKTPQACLLALADVGSAGAHRQQPFDLGVLVTGPEVGMYPVLHRLGSIDR